MTRKFEAKIEKIPDKDATYIRIPFDIEEEYGTKRLKVKVKFDGVEYRGSIVRMGMDCYILGMTKAIRKAIGKEAEDCVLVEIEEDKEIREVELPEDMIEALVENEKAEAFYEGLSYSAKRKYVQWITSAKKEETRKKRITEAISKLEAQIK